MESIKTAITQAIIRKALNQRLPDFEAPGCCKEGCTAQLDDPRPLYAEQSTEDNRILHVHCLAKCPACGAAHMGVRDVRLDRGAHSAGQSFHLYNEEDRAVLAELMPKIQANPGKLLQIQRRA